MLVGGEAGRHMEDWSDEETSRWFMSILFNMFGDHTADPIEIIRTQWTRDPFSRGAYSFIAVGATPTDIEALAEPIADRVFFAGEATYRQHWATAHGAYVSGLREAARIAADPAILPTRHFTENRRWRDMTRRMTRLFNLVSASTSSADLKARLEILEESDVFASVPPSELQILATMFEPMTFTDGQVICRVGEPASQVYAIAEGEIEVQLGDGSTILVLKRGNVVGEYGLFGAHTRTATLISRGQSQALALDYHRFHRFLLAFPESSLALLRLTVDRLMDEVNARRTTSLSDDELRNRFDPHIR
jgi:CRP-like cAMP-binding protein